MPDHSSTERESQRAGAVWTPTSPKDTADGPAASSEAVVSVQSVSKHYSLYGETIPALQDVSLNVDRGRFVAIMGASGSGKTTLLNLLGGLDQPDGGHIVIGGRDLTGMSDAERTIFRRRNIGIVFQAYNLLSNLTARENVMLPILVDGRSASAAAGRADELIRMVHLDHRARHHPAAMSGGEQQRVAIARALMTQPDLILADEPTGNLDPRASLEIWRLLAELSRRLNTTVVMVTHEATAAAHADRVHVLKQGRFAGAIESGGSGDASLVAARYAELAD